MKGAKGRHSQSRILRTLRAPFGERHRRRRARRTPDFEHWNDGVRLDRERLIAHARPARRNAETLHVDVHDAFVAGNRVAARYTMRACMWKGREVEFEICIIGHLAPDGRLRRIDQLTRTL
jgi:hypothetical protein